MPVLPYKRLPGKPQSWYFQCPRCTYKSSDHTSKLIVEGFGNEHMANKH
jgi:hypothetical protein